MAPAEMMENVYAMMDITEVTAQVNRFFLRLKLLLIVRTVNLDIDVIFLFSFNKSSM